MRSTLVDWIVQVHSRFGLVQETLFLAVDLLDRFMSIKSVGNYSLLSFLIQGIDKFQLLGITCLYIACMYT